MPKSMMFDSTCQWPCGCMAPPMTPNGMNGLPSFVTKPGMLVCSDRLWGSSELRWPASSEKPEPRFWRAKPRSPGTTFEPKPPKMLSMSEDGVAVLVDHRQVHGVAVVERLPRGDVGRRALWGR